MIIVVVLDFDFPARLTIRTLLCDDRKATICLHSTSILSALRLVSIWVFPVSVFASFRAAKVNLVFLGRSNGDAVSVVSSMASKCSLYSLGVRINGFL